MVMFSKLVGFPDDEGSAIVMEGLVVAVFWAPAAFFLAGLNS